MSMTRRVGRIGWLAGLGLLLASGIAAAAGRDTAPASPAGRWDAVVILANDAAVPFRFEISGRGNDLKGSGARSRTVR
jgi:hypothetical protein